MKWSWTHLKISLTGAKLIHLVQKDKIWDHGSMVEQARIIFYLLYKAKAIGNIESLKKQCSVACFERLRDEMNGNANERETMRQPDINELAVLEVRPGKNNRPDMFTALIKHSWKNDLQNHDRRYQVTAYWSFIRQGEWWMLDSIKANRSIF